MTQDEVHWIERLQRQDEAAFTHLYQEYGTRLYRFCYRLCGNRADAEDLTQEVFVAAYQGRHRFQGRSSLATWLYQIACFQRHNMLRVRRHQTVAYEEARMPATDDAYEAGLERLSLQRALAALPEPLRQAFLLVKAEGLTCREAAEALHVPQGTLKFRVHQAAAKLRHLLQHDAEIDLAASPLPTASLNTRRSLL